MACCELEARKWHCCCGAESMRKCICWPIIEPKQMKPLTYPYMELEIHEKPKLKYIKIRTL